MFGIYDDLTPDHAPDHVPGLQKYDMCMTEQVPGPQGVKIVGRHMPSAPNKQKRKAVYRFHCFAKVLYSFSIRTGFSLLIIPLDLPHPMMLKTMTGASELKICTVMRL